MRRPLNAKSANGATPARRRCRRSSSAPSPEQIPTAAAVPPQSSVQRSRRNKSRADHGDNHQNDEIAHRRERGIEMNNSGAAETSRRANSPRRLALKTKSRMSQGSANCWWTRSASSGLTSRNGNIRWPNSSSRTKLNPCAGIPRRDTEMRVGLDEADPIEQGIGHEIGHADDDLVSIEDARESHRQRSLRLGRSNHQF